MSTPPRMVEIACPRCQHLHWEIDRDFRGSALVGQRELPYHGRTYECPACHEAPTGFRVLRQSPPAFFLQPHPMYPMSTREFAHWLAIFRVQFPSDYRLGSVGVFWYPGESGQEQEMKLRDTRQVGAAGGYRLTLSNRSPEDKRIRVCVQGRGGSEAHFWCGPEVELDQGLRIRPNGDRDDSRASRGEGHRHSSRVAAFFKKGKGGAREWLTRLLRLEGGES